MERKFIPLTLINKIQKGTNEIKSWEVTFRCSALGKTSRIYGFEYSIIGGKCVLIYSEMCFLAQLSLCISRVPCSL